MKAAISYLTCLIGAIVFLFAKRVDIAVTFACTSIIIWHLKFDK
jgi:hypothetical protein